MDNSCSFVVPGDPIPYLRMTQSQVKLVQTPARLLTKDRFQVRERMLRYFRYKELAQWSASQVRFDRAPTGKLFFNVVVYFRDRRHADPENVRKGLQDALFEQDRHVAGSVDFHYDPVNPRCEVMVQDTLLPLPDLATTRYTFEVPGEPIPYLRMTQGQLRLMRLPQHRLDEKQLKVRQRIERYLSYKDFAFLCGQHCRFKRAPDSKVYFNVMVYFGKRKGHADPENIRKGLQDALYQQDRYVAGSVDFSYDVDRPRCEIEVVELGGAA